MSTATTTPCFLPPATGTSAALAPFHPAIQAWFPATFGTPTAVQATAWPALLAGHNCLISAPTGMGKTLAAFLPILDALLPRPGSPWRTGGRLRAVYLSPLKALATDVARNLQRHLDGIAAHLPSNLGLPRLSIRHSDTSSDERRRLATEPPEILLTTPESLAVLLSRPELQNIFAPLTWVIVDELHALAGGKRGADLALGVERLDRLAGGRLQRVGISATATPLDEAARFLVGVDRPCTIALQPATAPLDIRIQPMTTERTFFGEVVERLIPEIEANRSVLVFTQSRRLAERLSWVLRGQRPEWDDRIAVHHSCLAAERRRRVEEQLKGGHLRAVICSTSLEMGVDIGSVDLVVLVHPPGDVVRLLQRLGRAGHGPLRVRRGLILVGPPGELLEAAVTAASGQAGQCEPIPFAAGPLDVLCQHLAGLGCTGPQDADDLFAMVRRAAPYRHLTRDDFDACLRYLRGLDRHGNSWLPARLRDDLSIVNQRTARLLRRNFGTILGEQQVRVEVEVEPPAESEEFEPRRQEIGEIDPSFAERLEPGDRFLLDGRSLEVRQKGLDTVLVRDSTQRPLLPRWTGSGLPMSTELAARLFALRVQAAEALRDGPVALAALLRTEYDLDDDAVARLAAYFERQEAVSEIPEDGGALVEVVRNDHSEVYYVHTCLNRAGNDALSRLVTHRLARDHGRSSTSIVADLGFLLLPRGGALTPLSPHVLRAGEGAGRGLGERGTGALANLWRTLLDPAQFRDDLRVALTTSYTERERFARVAQIGLMVLRNPDARRRGRVGGESWTRRRLFEQIRDHEPDFALLRQARRELETEVCDEAAAFAWATQLRQHLVRCRWLVQPSPFAESWTQTSLGGLEVVETPDDTLRRLHARLMETAP